MAKVQNLVSMARASLRGGQDKPVIEVHPQMDTFGSHMDTKLPDDLHKDPRGWSQPIWEGTKLEDLVPLNTPKPLLITHKYEEMEISNPQVYRHHLIARVHGNPERGHHSPAERDIPEEVFQWGEIQHWFISIQSLGHHQNSPRDLGNNERLPILLHPLTLCRAQHPKTSAWGRGQNGRDR